MTSTSSTTHRRRRLVAAVLALPLALAMSGTASASGPAGADTGALRTAADTRSTTAGSAAGAASGKSAATATTTSTSYVNGNTNSSKADRPNAPVTRSAAPSQPLSTADKTGKGANVGTAENCATTNPYCSNGTGVEPGNGNDSAPAKGQPCAGCVGKADNKNPKGQAPGGSDRNAGYECDRNQGIGQMNPAHTGCTTTATPAPTATKTPPATKSPDPKPTATKTPGNGTASITVTADCRTVSVVSTKDISHVVVFFKDGTSQKFDGLSGKTWTRTFTKDVASARAKSATSTATGTATGCGVLPTGTPTPTPTACPSGSSMPGNGNGNAPCKDDDDDRKVTLCHATGSATNPYVMITISEKALPAHRDHQDGRDIIPAPAGGCPTAPATADACPALSGMQAPGTSCTPQTGVGPAPVDACPAVPGMQPMGPCTVGGGAQTPAQDPPGNGGSGNSPIGGVTPDQPASGSVTSPVTGPPTTVPPVLVANGNRPPTLVGAVTSPATRPAAARPRALPFTGTETVLLLELGALLLLAGGGMLLAARRERTARAR